MYQSATISSSHSGASTSSGPSRKPAASMRVVAGATPIIAAQTGDLFFAQSGSIHPSSGGGKQQQRLVAQSGVIVTQTGLRLDKQINLHAALQQHHHHHHHRHQQHRHGSFFKPSGVDQTITTFDASHFVFPKSRDALAKKRRPPLRRYNSDESHGGGGAFFAPTSSSSASDNSPMSTNERLTPTPTTTKPLSRISGSLSSRSASSTTPDTSPESTEARTRRPEYGAREFVERYSLPRVVRVVGDGRPMLVYKFIDEYVNVLARPIVGKKGREKIDAAVLYFPDAYQGWFSLTNDRGDRTAVAYTSLLQLVQEQVYTFLSTTAIAAYASKSNDNDPHSPSIKPTFFNAPALIPNNNDDKPSPPQHKSQYVKCTLHPGQVFKLRAVFQHNDRDDVDNVKSSRSRRERDLANRYAQLIDEKNQELYVPLTTRGEFFEISSSPRPKLILPGHDEKDRPRNPLFVDKDCIYRLGYLLKKCSLPVKLRLLAGPVPEGFRKDFTDLYLFERKVSEPVLLACSLVDDAPELTCLGVDGVRFARTLLGHDTERTLFASTRLQAALSFLRAHSDAWRRRVRLESEWTSFERTLRGAVDTDDRRRSVSSVLPAKGPEPTSKPSKWLRHFKFGGGPEVEAAPDERRRSLDRYKDMSKLIEERFGVRRKKASNPVKKSASFMFALKRTDIDGVGPVTQASKSHSSLVQTVGATVDEKPPVSNPTPRPIPEEEVTDVGLDLKICDADDKLGHGNVRRTYGRSLNDVTDVGSKIAKGYTCSLKDLTRPGRPDVIPSTDPSKRFVDDGGSPEPRRCENSFITDRLCSEFHVKTKNVVRPGRAFVPPKKEFRRKEKRTGDGRADIARVQSRALPVIEDLPYCSAVDALETKTARADAENIYAEICEDGEDTGPATDVEYPYVRLGSGRNDDDGIYNTLR